MSGKFTHITQPVELDERDVEAAVFARDATRALLIRLATVAAPDSGVAKVLAVFARMATSACDWIDGDLCVELVGDGEMTLVETSTELGGGLRERIFAPLPFRAPLGEFAGAIESVPDIIAPLSVRAKTERRITLSAADVARGATKPPPPIRISRDSLFARKTPLHAPPDASEGPSLPLVTSAAPAALGATKTPRPKPADQATSEPPPGDLGDVDAGWDD